MYRKSEYRFLEHIKELMTAENRTPDKSPGVVIRDLNVINWAWNKYAEENELLTTKEETRKHQYFLGKQKKAEDVDDIKRIKKEWIIRLQRAEAGLHTLRSRSSSASSFAVPEDNNFINDFIEEDSGEESGMPENREEGQNWANMEDRSDGGELAQDYVWRNRDDESLIDAREKVLFANNKSSIEDNGLSVLDDLEDDDYDDGRP